MNIARRSLASAGFCALLTSWSGAQAQDLSVGAVFPLSGPNASYSEVYMSGTNLAVQHANADKLLAGKLSMKYEDSQALPQQGVIAMTKLVNVDKVPYVLTAFTGVSKAISGITQRSQTITVNGGAVSPDLAKLGPYFWNVIPLAHSELPTLLRYLVQQRKASRFVLVYVDDPLGGAIKNELEKGVKGLGGQLVDALAVPVGSQQFGGIAAKVRDAKPDVVYIASSGAQQNQIIKQLRDNGVTQQLASYSAFSLPDTQKLPEAKGTLWSSQKIDWNATDAITKRFLTDFKAANGNRQPGVYAANYYNAVRLFAILAGELQKAGKPVNGETLVAQRSAMKSFDLVGGRYTFEADGTVLSPIQINEIDGGSGKVVPTNP